MSKANPLYGWMIFFIQYFTRAMGIPKSLACGYEVVCDYAMLHDMDLADPRKSALTTVN